VLAREVERRVLAHGIPRDGGVRVLDQQRRQHLLRARVRVRVRVRIRVRARVRGRVRFEQRRQHVERRAAEHLLRARG